MNSTDCEPLPGDHAKNEFGLPSGRPPRGYLQETTSATTAPQHRTAASQTQIPQTVPALEVWRTLRALPLSKRFFDILIAALLFVAAAPLLLIVAIGILIDSPGPVLFRCRRVGRGGHEFQMLKFRKMREGVTGPTLTSVHDERFTRVGAMLARTKLDELPQLWNVLRGEMSLVGPRPEDPGFVALFRHEYAEVLRVRPGITGLSQLAFARESRLLVDFDPVSQYVERLLPQKLAIDRLYVAQHSIVADLRILAWTVAAVALHKEVSVHRGTGALAVRRRGSGQSTEPPSTADARANGARGADGHLDLDLRVRVSLHRTQTPWGIKTVILAGGKGTRLMPYTAVLPKPLMPLGDRAILEFVVRQLADQGLVDITLSVGHLAHLVEAVFGNGADYGVKITYVREDLPLGTAGPLRLVDGLDDMFLVLNGDLVTTIDYRDLVRHHRACGNLLTIAATKREVQLDYGVLELASKASGAQQVAAIHEKPSIERIVSMGIYVLEPLVLKFIPDNGIFDFPNLVCNLLADNQRVGAYTYDGLWLDIGRHEDYERALALHEQGKLDPAPRRRTPLRGKSSG